MSLLHEIEWEKPLIEPYRDPEAEALVRKQYGFVMESTFFYSRSPWVLRSLVRFDIQRDVLVHVDADLAETIGLVVSQDNSCRFCYAASRALLRFQGYSESRIERLDRSQQPEPLSAERLQQSLGRVTSFVENTARLFADWAQGYQAHTNQLPPADQALCQSVGGDPNIFYYHSHWALAEDEALVIHIDKVPDCDFWNLQINNYWMESLDYRHHRICLNKHSAQTDARGGVRMVLSHRDPGLPNWLETAGHADGTLCLRWVGAEHPVHPTTRVVKLDHLKELL